MHTSVVIILGKNINDDVEATLVHHRTLCRFDYSVEAYKPFQQKNLWTHSEIQYLPFLLAVNYGVSFFTAMHDLYLDT